MITDMEKLKRAKMYIDKLADGVDPLTDQTLPDGDIVNNVRICRCFAYVSEILGQVIENGGEVGRKTVVKVTKAPFAITPEQAAAIEITETPVGVTILAKRIAAVLDEEVKPLSVVNISDWCLAQGLLTEETHGNHKRKVSTLKGNQYGIITVDSVNMQGVPYKKNIYDQNAQKFIIDHLADIAEFCEK